LSLSSVSLSFDARCAGCAKFFLAVDISCSSVAVGIVMAGRMLSSSVLSSSGEDES
jgi:hypothetical protein